MGMSWAVATTVGWNAVLAITFPRMLSVFTAVGAFSFYAGLNVVAFFMVFFFMPETKQRTLEELDYVFDVSTWKHAKYQGGVYLPWFIKRSLCSSHAGKSLIFGVDTSFARRLQIQYIYTIPCGVVFPASRALKSPTKIHHEHRRKYSTLTSWPLGIAAEGKHRFDRMA